MKKFWSSVFGGKAESTPTEAEVVEAEAGGGSNSDLPVAVAVESSSRNVPILASPATRGNETSARQAVAVPLTPSSTSSSRVRRYKDCVTKDEKIAWLQSEYGQEVLAQRPVLQQYYQTGYIYRIIDNKHWKVRLEEWLTLEEEEQGPTVNTSGPSEATVPGKAAYMAASSSGSSSGSSQTQRGQQGREDEKSTAEKSAAGKAMLKKKGGTLAEAPKVPYGLNLPKTEQEKERDRDDSLIPYIHHNPPIQVQFKAAFERFRGSTFSFEDKLHLLTEGYIVKRNVIPLELIANANRAVNDAIQQDNELIHLIGKKLDRDELSERMKRRREMDPYFLSGGLNHIDVLALYYNSPVYHMVEDILHNHSGKGETHSIPFRVSVGGCQVAYRFSQPRPNNTTMPSVFNLDKDKQYNKGREYIGGKSWHVDGLENGKYGSFSFLIGFALNDQMGEFSGNLCLHPGSHYTLLPYLKQYFNSSDAVQQGDDPELYQQRAKQVKKIERPDLGEPVQVTVNAGDVVFALHKVAHLGGRNYSTQIRKMLYFRVSHRNHSALRAQSFDNVWVEFEGMQELANM